MWYDVVGRFSWVRFGVLAFNNTKILDFLFFAKLFKHKLME